MIFDVSAVSPTNVPSLMGSLICLSFIEEIRMEFSANLHLPPPPQQYYVKLPRAKFGVWHACNLSAKPGVAIYKRHTVLNDIQRLILTVHCAGKCIRNSKVVILLCVSKKITVSRPQKCIVHFSLNMTAAFLLSSIPKLSLGVR